MAIALESPPVPTRIEQGDRLRAQTRRVLLIGAAVAALALAVSLVGLVVDPRVIQGAPAWLKPMKFGVSILAYLLTLRWMAGLIRGRVRGLRTAAVVIVVAFTGELIAIDMQVVRDTTSHFNTATVFDASVYYGMGGLIMTAFAATVVAAVLAVRSRGLDAGASAGIRWGLVVALVGMAEAVLMITNTHWHAGGGHTVGAQDGGPGLPITDWSLDHGDLRIGHFLGLHGLQVLPLVAWALARCTPFDARTRARLITVAALGWIGLVALATWQALRGQALLRPDATTLEALAALVAAVLVAATLTVRTRRS